jgi:hypothetical protein
MKNIFLGTSGLLMAQILFAGSAQVGVDCKSDSGDDEGGDDDE